MSLRNATETDMTLFSHLQDVTIYLFTQESSSEKLCEVSLKCDASYQRDTLSGVYDMDLYTFNTAFKVMNFKRAMTFICRVICIHACEFSKQCVAGLPDIHYYTLTAAVNASIFI